MSERKLGQERAPLWEALANHAAGRRARFHVPAHGGRFPALKQLLGPGARFDLTELEGLDDLHAPAGPISEAEQLAAVSLGADEAHFLVGGTSAGIEALLLAVARPGARVLIGRDAHRSVVAGLILAGADPVFMLPRIDASGRSLGVPAEEVAAALAANPDAVACQLTNPNYFGVERDYTRILASAAIPVLVDEAHGVDRYYSGPGAGGALAGGAGGVALSMHKSGLSLTQSAIVAVRGPAVNRGRLRAALRLIQSSSPSYLLMASLDLARRELAIRGAELIAAARDRRQRLAERVAGIPGLAVWTPQGCGIRADHPLRLLIDVARLGISGWRAAEFLGARGIDCELADFTGVLLALDCFGSETADRRLLAALRELARAHRENGRSPAARHHLPALPVAPHSRALTPREAFFAGSEYVPLNEAAGRIAADAVCPYPPGVPLLVPGEVVTTEDQTVVSAILRAGGRVQGLDAADRIAVVSRTQP